MRNLITTICLFTLIPAYIFAQCSVDQREVKVNILTDDYGSETSWTFSDLSGTVVMKGGQEGVYGNFRSYTDSTCIAKEDCYFFEIYDTYGDGIFKPHGYRLFVDDVLVSSENDAIKDYKMISVNCADSCRLIESALEDLQAHIKGTNTLSPNEQTLVRNTFVQFSECLAENEAIIVLAKNVVNDYDTKIGPLFTTPRTKNGFSKNPASAPGYELERAMIALEQGILDHVFSPSVYADYPHLIHGWKFNACSAFPGFVSAPTDSTISHSLPIRANFADPDGSNPYFDINMDRMKHALRPTGLYLAPGSVVTLTVPASLVGKDFWVRVGSHDWDLTRRSDFRRLDRISKKFAIDSTTITVFNPMGGAISVLVPYEADEGIVTVHVKNAVEAPFYSWKTFHKTADFDAELSKPAPWAVFETDNVMFTIPKHSIVPGEYDLKQTLMKWDTALQAVNSVMARQIISDKHNMYMIADVDIRFDAYSIGYPMSNTPLNYDDVPGPAYFLNGPGPDDEVNFHESGHALAMSKFAGEEEALVNFPYVMAMNYGLGQDLDEAVNYSFVPNTFGVDNTATHRMVSNSFGTTRDITNSTTNEVRYQHRGYGHYFEIVNMFGWCPLRNFWKQESIDFENGIDHGINDQDSDKRIVRMSVAAQEDLRPLFHVFGIIAKDSIRMQDTMTQLGIQPSLTVYNRLQAYFDLIPKDKEAFIEYAKGVYPSLFTEGPVSDPDYGVGWHYLKSLAYDEAEAQRRTNILQSIVDRYFPNGKPADSGVKDVCCLLDTMHVMMINEEITVSGGVKPYTVTIDTIGDIKTVTVIDFDGCETMIQSVVSSSQEHYNNDILHIYPNPTSSEIYLNFSNRNVNDNIDEIQIVTMAGKVLSVFENNKRMIDMSPFASGMYMLKVKLRGGELINKRVMVIR